MTTRPLLARIATIGLALVCIFGCGPTEPAQSSATSSEASAGLGPTFAPTVPGPLLSSSSFAPQPSSTAAVASPSSRKRYVVAAMGDSLSDPKSHGAKYLDVLRERCPNSTFSAFGVGGNMVNMMRKRFLRDVYGEGTNEQRPRFTHVLILGGLGDILSNETAFRTAKKIAEDITKMAQMARDHGAKAIVLTLPPWGAMKEYNAERAKMTTDVNAWIDSAEREGTVDGTFDTRPHLLCGDAHRLCKDLAWVDGIHWSKKGHDVIGDALHRAHFSDCE